MSYTELKAAQRHHRDNEIHLVQSAVNQPKSELIRLLSRLEQAEAYQKAKSLGTIIAALEAWQKT